jgi:hypothetical protein
MSILKTLRGHERDLMLAIAKSKARGVAVLLSRETTESLLRSLAIAAKYIESAR